MIDTSKLSLLDGNVLKSLAAIRNKLDVDYLPFFNNVAKQYTGTKSTKESKLISDTISMIRSVVVEIDKTQLISDVSIVKEKTNKILDLVNNIKESATWLSNSQNVSKSLQGRLDRATKETNTSIGDIKRTSGIIAGRTKTILKEPSKLSSMMGGFAKSDIGQELGGGIKSMLGPFGTLGDFAGKQIGKYREHRAELGKKAFAGSVITGGEKSPEAFQNLYSYLFGEGKAKIPNVLGGDYGNKSTTVSEAMRSRSGSPTREKSPVEKIKESILGVRNVNTNRETVMMKDSLFDFFNTGAFKAKWTKMLIEAVAGKGVGSNVVTSSPSGMGGLLSQIPNIMGAISKLLPILGAVAGVAGAGLIGWGAGRLIGSKVKIGDKTVDEHVTGFAQKRMEVSDKKKRDKELEKLHPEVRRSMELQDQGMSIQDAGKQAHQELNKVPNETKEGVLVKSFRDNNDKLTSKLNEIAENTKKKEQTQTTPRSGYDANNIGDPLMDSVNGGSLDIKG